MTAGRRSPCAPRMRVPPRCRRSPRTPARVLRVWIAPWEDDAGRLHVPGYTYAEIEPRRWSIGGSEPSSTARLQPLPEPPQPLPVTPAPAPATMLVPLETQEASTGPTPRRQLRLPPAARRQAPADGTPQGFRPIRLRPEAMGGPGMASECHRPLKNAFRCEFLPTAGSSNRLEHLFLSSSTCRRFAGEAPRRRTLSRVHPKEPGMLKPAFPIALPGKRRPATPSWPWPSWPRP